MGRLGTGKPVKIQEIKAEIVEKPVILVEETELVVNKPVFKVHDSIQVVNRPVFQQKEVVQVIEVPKPELSKVEFQLDALASRVEGLAAEMPTVPKVKTEVVETVPGWLTAFMCGIAFLTFAILAGLVYSVH